VFLLIGGESSIGIREIRAIRGFKKIPTFPRNLRPIFRLYIREPPEMNFSR